MQASMKYPVYRKMNGGGTWYRVEGPARWVEFQQIGARWIRHEVAVRQHPERMTLQDLLTDNDRYLHSTEVEWKAAMDHQLPAGFPGCAVSSEPVIRTQNEDLGGLTTFGVPGRAASFIRAQSDDAVRSALNDRHSDEPLLVLGGGSNMLLHADWPGLVVHVDVRGMHVISDDGRCVEVVVGAGEPWHDWVMRTVEEGWRGLENLALIPGRVGAAPMQNIGAYGVEIKDRCVWVEAISIEDGAMRRFTSEECEFGYRESIFKGQERGRWVITRVAFRLDRQAPLNTGYGAIQEELSAVPQTAWTARDVAEAVIRIRRSKLPDPAKLGNAGSFFKNPVLTAEAFAQFTLHHPQAPHYLQADGTVKLAAGWLIEQAGWKGHDRGTHGVHDRQALVLVNKGGATGAQIWELAQNIRQDVMDQFQVDLEPEVNQVGLSNPSH
jgi:UDP-N-acetylmuramate dehydrogenase